MRRRSSGPPHDIRVERTVDRRERQGCRERDDGDIGVLAHQLGDRLVGLVPPSHPCLDDHDVRLLQTDDGHEPAEVGDDAAHLDAVLGQQLGRAGDGDGLIVGDEDTTPDVRRHDRSLWRGRATPGHSQGVRPAGGTTFDLTEDPWTTANSTRW